MRLWKPSWGYYWLLILWSCFWPLIRFLCSSHWKSITKTADKNCVLDFSNGNVNFYRIVFLCFKLEIWFLAVCRSNFQKKNMPAIFLSKLNSIANWIYGHCCLSIILQSRAWFFASFVFHSRTKKLDWLVFLDLEKYLYLKFVIEFINSNFAREWQQL